MQDDSLADGSDTSTVLAHLRQWRGARERVHPRESRGVCNLLRQRVEQVRADLINVFATEAGYSVDEATALYEAALRFVEHLPELVELHGDLIAEENRKYRSIGAACEFRLDAHGTCAITIPSNASL